MDIQFKKLSSPLDKDWSKAMKLYEESFPSKERRSIQDHIRAIADPRFYSNTIYFGDEFAGIFFFWEFSEFCYGEFLAIEPSMRSHKIGSRVINHWADKYERVFLEIEPPTEEMAIRRKGFYERNGFVANSHHHVHPAFCRPFEPHQLILMSRPSLLSDAEFEAITEYIQKPVITYSEHNTPSTDRE